MNAEPEWLIVGCVVKPHGIHGDLVVEIISDFPDRLAAGVRFGLGAEAGPEAYFEVHRVRIHKHSWLLSVVGLRSREDAESWRGRYLFLPALARDELPAGYYYEHQLEGLECRDPAGVVLGTVVGVDSGGGQTRLVVERDGRRYLVPYVPQIVEGVDLEAATVTIRPLPGLLDDDAILA